jgi:hypothetical protein
VEAGLGLADAARRAFDWIGSVAVDADGGLGWLEGGVLADDPYSGTAGVLPGCTEAAAPGLGTAQVSAGARARLLHLARHGSGDTALLDWTGLAPWPPTSQTAPWLPRAVSSGLTPNTPESRPNCPQNQGSCRVPPESPAGWPDSTPFTPALASRPSRPGPAHHGFDGTQPGLRRLHTHQGLNAGATTGTTAMRYAAGPR